MSKLFDTKRIKYRKLKERKNLLTLSQEDFRQPRILKEERLNELSKKIINAKKKKSSIIFSFGAHSIRNGLTPYFQWFMEQGFVTHFATNGASVIHDWEFSYQGATTECVKTGLEKGTFGLWEETNYHINKAINEGTIKKLGFGESIGYYMEKNSNLHPNKEFSLFYSCYKNKIPITVHPCYGQDIFFLHPTSKGKNIGKTAQIDLLKYAKSIENISGGVLLNIGSAILGPMIFKKCFAAAQNIKIQQRKKLDDFKIFCIDLAPEKFKEKEKNFDYFQRFQKTFSRVPNSEYIQADNLDFMASLKEYIKINLHQSTIL